MNATESSFPRIEIKESHSKLSGQTASMGGMTFLVFAMAMFAGIFRNQWGMVPMLFIFIGVGLALQWAERWFNSTSTKYLLLPDSMSIDSSRLALDEIESIKWPTDTSNEKLFVIVKVRGPVAVNEGAENAPSELDQKYKIEIRTLGREDRLLLIRYLQQQDCEHLSWPEFCSLYLDRWLKVPSRIFSDGFNERLVAAPFWTGFICTPYIFSVCVLMVSKRVYFALAATIAISAVINIRLWHGHWFSPIGETVLCVAALLFLFGIVAWLFPQFQTKREVTASERTAGRQAGAVLVIAYVFGPLAMQLLVQIGWVTVASLLLQIIPWTPVVPMVVAKMRERKRLRDNAKESLPNIMGKWKAYCEESIEGRVLRPGLTCQDVA